MPVRSEGVVATLRPAIKPLKQGDCRATFPLRIAASRDFPSDQSEAKTPGLIPVKTY